MIQYEKKANLAIINWTMTGEGNLWTAGSTKAFSTLVHKAINDPAVSGVIITSGNEHFHLGDDLQTLMALPTAQSIMTFCSSWHKITRAIETSPKPFVAAINGTALGTGLELCLACHHRISSNDNSLMLGFPQTKYGLSLRGGGTQRIPRMLGIRSGTQGLLSRTNFTSKEALALNLLDQIVPAEQLMRKAESWLAAPPQNVVKPWDKKNYKLPGIQIWDPEGMGTLTAANALLHKQTKGNYPAYKAILSCVYEGLQVPFEAGLRIESRWFANILLTDVAKNMVRTFCFSINEAKGLSRRPKTHPVTKFETVGVIGAGMMGRGIAHASIGAGLKVVLLDTDEAKAKEGKQHIANLLAKESEGTAPNELFDHKLLQNIHPTSTFSDLSDSQLVIEAVFEDRYLKNEVIHKTRSVVPSDTVFASNTSTLPISSLASSYSNPEKFIGLHFFSPVNRMQLVEIIVGQKTSDATLCRAMDFVQQIGKTPIIVNDSRGFYTSRVFGTYVQEGLSLLADGVKPALIENVGRLVGMPLGPLAVADEVSLELIHKVELQTKSDLGDLYVPPPGETVIEHMVYTLGRLGQKSHKGFYEYPKDGKKYLWPELDQEIPLAHKSTPPDVNTIKRRLLYIQALEATRCLEEDVVTCPEDADIGSVLGWGFAPHTGGVLSMIDSVGLNNFIHECDLLAQNYGKRFSPSTELRQRAANQKTFY
jgi:3-hydroxyacyl-CoA dehydrogenase/enoyl-CoA hydratase/3-hydroxybutyryl-CoA epimerase